MATNKRARKQSEGSVLKKERASKNLESITLDVRICVEKCLGEASIYNISGLCPCWLVEIS